MTEKEQKELTDRAIPGITWKQVAAFTVAVWALIMVYLNLQQTAEAADKRSSASELLLKETVQEYKQAIMLNQEMINQLKIEQREFDFRLKQLEKDWENFVEGYTKGNKKYK